jgi:hypothetical protein
MEIVLGRAKDYRTNITVDTTQITAIQINNGSLNVGVKNGISIGVPENRRSISLSHILAEVARYEGPAKLAEVPVLIRHDQSPWTKIQAYSRSPASLKYKLKTSGYTYVEKGFGVDFTLP